MRVVEQQHQRMIGCCRTYEASNAVEQAQLTITDDGSGRVVVTGRLGKLGQKDRELFAHGPSIADACSARHRR